MHLSKSYDICISLIKKSGIFNVVYCHLALMTAYANLTGEHCIKHDKLLSIQIFQTKPYKKHMCSFVE